jgi:ADP-heptose:LPS heptosyltransferase
MKTPLIKSIEHGFKRLVFGAARIVLKKGRRDFGPIDPKSIKRILFLRPDKLGDMIVSLPVFHNLKKSYPHLELYAISSPRNAIILQHGDLMVRNYLYTKKPFRDYQMLRHVRRLNVDAIVDMVRGDSVTALFLAQYCSRRAWRIGAGKTHHGRYYDINIEYGAEDDGHAVDNALQLLTAFGLAVDSLEKYVPPTLAESSQQFADRFIGSLNGNASEGIIGINISAGRPTRVWPEDKMIELIRRLRITYPNSRIIISADPRERARAVSLAEQFEARVDSLPSGLGLLDVAAIISRMKLLVTPDTSLVHIARSFRVPVVGLYTHYRPNFRLWRPYGQSVGTIQSGNDYNIFDITVDDVFDAVTALLSQGEKS